MTTETYERACQIRKDIDEIKSILGDTYDQLLFRYKVRALAKDETIRKVLLNKIQELEDEFNSL